MKRLGPKSGWRSFLNFSNTMKSSRTKQNRPSLKEEDLKTPARVNVDKVINEIRTLRSRLSEITPVSSPSLHNKRKTTHFESSINSGESDSDRDPFRVNRFVG